MIYTLHVPHGHEVWIKSKEHGLIVIAYAGLEINKIIKSPFGD